MLLKDFYSIVSQAGSGEETGSDGVVNDHQLFTLMLNPHHPVYEGHFPGNPVVPGVCQILMIKELISRIKQRPVRLVKADNIKFLSLIVPQKNQHLEFDITCRDSLNENISASVIIRSGEIQFLKFKGSFSPI